MEIIVGGIIEKNGKVLLVQEAKKACYGKWNLPAGHLEPNETLKDGALREIKEETGYDVELTGILNIANKTIENDLLLVVIFSTNIIGGNIKINEKEILSVKWFDIDDVINNMDDELRDIKFIKEPLINYKEHTISSIDLINEI